VWSARARCGWCSHDRKFLQVRLDLPKPKPRIGCGCGGQGVGVGGAAAAIVAYEPGMWFHTFAKLPLRCPLRHI